MSLYRKPQSLKDERSRLFSQAEKMLDTLDAESRDFTKAEQSTYDGILAKIESTTKLIALQSMEGSTGQPGADGSFTPIGGDPMANRITSVSSGTVRAFADTRDGRASAYRSGQFIRATLAGDEAALSWCRNSGQFPDIEASVRMAHSAGSNSAGGVLVGEEFSSVVIKLIEQYGVFRQLVRVNPMGSDTLHLPRRVGGLQAHYTGEGVAGTESDSTWDDVQLVAKKLMVLTRMSSELNDDAVVSMADQLAEEIGLAFALKEDSVGFVGTGISTDGGIVGVNVEAIDGSHGLASVAAASGHDTLPEIDADDIIRLMAAVPSYAKRGSSFVCSPTALELVFNAIKVAGGGNSLENLANMVSPVFLGYPIAVSDIYPDSASGNCQGNCRLDLLTHAAFSNVSGLGLSSDLSGFR